MLAILLGMFRLVWLFGRGHHAVVLENLALRQQLLIYKRTKRRPPLVGRDRWFWIALSAVWKDWWRPLFVVHPDTLVRRQRERFRRYWAQRSKKSGRPGRPPISRQVHELIRTMACANPLSRIHGELRNSRFQNRTVSRVLRTVKRPPSQTWKTFLQNHIGLTSSRYRPSVYGFCSCFLCWSISGGKCFISESRNIPGPNGPHSRWWNLRGTGLQAVLGPRPRCDLWPRVSASNPVVGHEGGHPCRSPWQNAFAERMIGSIRRECLDHAVVLSQRHLRKLLKSYSTCYHRSRTHLALAKDAPESRAIMNRGEIVAIPQVGGLHRRYGRRAA
jgi:putative transposase